MRQGSLAHRPDRLDALACINSLPLAQAVFFYTTQARRAGFVADAN